MKLADAAAIKVAGVDAATVMHAGVQVWPPAASALAQGIAVAAQGSGVVTTPARTTTPGSTLVGIQIREGGAFTSFDDNMGNTFIPWGTEQSLIGYSPGKGRVFYCENANGGAGHTFTGRHTGAAATVMVTEIIGAKSVGALDVSAQGRDASSPYTLALPATSQADTMLVALMGITGAGSNAVATEHTGFTVVAAVPEYAYMQGALATRIVSAAGSYTPSFTITSSNDVMLWAAAFKS